MRAGFAIELAAGCNLSCPSCPQRGGSGGRDAPALIEIALLQRLLGRITRDHAAAEILLYNWGEPWLHPELAEAVRLCRAIGARCHLSTNLNRVPDLDAVLAAGPYSLRVSVSGFEQPTYGRTHAGGDVERVKRNLRALRDGLARTRSRTRVQIYFHRYLDNLDDEPQLRALARSLGFGFHPVWAVLCSVDQVLQHLGEAAALGPPGKSTTAEVATLIANLALPLDGALAAARRQEQRDCELRDWMLPIDTRGNARLCCAVFDDALATIGPMLELSSEEIAAQRIDHALCRRCMAHGVHVYQSLGSPEFDRLAAERIGPELASRGSLRMERLLKRARHALPRRLRRPLLELFVRLGRG